MINSSARAAEGRRSGRRDDLRGGEPLVNFCWPKRTLTVDSTQEILLLPEQPPLHAVGTFT